MQQGGAGERGTGLGEVERISPEDARREVEAGRAVLVCAYEDEARCRQLRLENAISLNELRRRIDTIPRDRTLIFYCG
jgi:hypothetical protein